jgi:hypothetical protein
MADTFDLNSHDISSVGKAPALRFTINSSRRGFWAEAPGGRIDVTALSDDGRTSRIVITNTLTNEVFADLVSNQVDAPSVGDDWTNPAVYAAEIGAALYWSMWRKQQLDAERVRGVLLEAVDQHKAAKLRDGP